MKQKEIEIQNLLNEIFPPNGVLFIGSNVYKPINGWGDTEEEYITVVTNKSYIQYGVKKMCEFIVEANEEILGEISILMPNDFRFGLAVEDVIDFLNEKNIKWEFKNVEDAPCIIN